MRKKNSWFYFLSKLYDFLPPQGISLNKRGKFISKYFREAGDNLKVSSNVNFYNPEKIAAGDNVYIGYNCYFGGGEINLDDEVIIGPYCSIVAGIHSFENESFRYGKYEFKSIEIGRGTWIASHCVISAGVKVGKGCLVAAGSVVVKDVPDFTMVGGVPAKFIKKNI